MKINLASLVILSACLLLTRCSDTRNILKLEHTNFTEEIVPDQNLVFTFGQLLAPDSILNIWDTTEYISFNPAVKGKFKWNSGKELVFSPYAPFAPSTEFTAEITPAVLKYSDKRLKLPKENLFTFHTPFLTMANAQVFWALSQQNPGNVEIRINLNFNCLVKPAELNKHLHILVNEKEVKFNVLDGQSSQIIGVSIDDVRGDSKESIPLKITIDPGLACEGSTYTTKEKMEFLYEVPAKEKIMVTEMIASFVEGQGSINVFTNQPVINENLAALIKINPTVTITAEKLDNGFVIKGDFEADKSYEVAISKELKGIFGFTLEDDYSQTVAFGELEPMIAFANERGMYLSSRGSRNVAVNIASVNKVKVSVVRIYENNIMGFVRSDERWGYYDESFDDDADGEYEYYYHDYRYYDYDDYGDVVFDKEYEVQSLPKNGNVRLMNLNPEEIGYYDRFKGMYLLIVQDIDHQWVQESKFISLSDLGIIAKQGEDEMHVFINSILNTEPLSGVKVNFISTNNQLVTTVSTGNDGVAVLKNAKSTLGKFRVGMVTCTQGDDFNFMILGNSNVSTSGFEVGGKHVNDAHLDAFIYGDREIYRPGDSIHFNTVIRTDDWKVIKNIPVKVKLLLPSGKEYQSYKKTPGEQGAFETSVYLPNSIMTGTYTIEVFTSNDVYIGGKQISVEEFVPDRIKIDAQTDKKEYKPGEKVTTEIIATNLFGPPAVNRNYEVELQLNREDFYSKKFNKYWFGISTSDLVPLENVLRTGKTNAEGKINESFELPSYTDIGLLDGKVFTTVFDESGRPVHKMAEFNVSTQKIFYGIRYFDRWIDTKKPLTIQFIALNLKEQAVSSEATVEIYRHEWHTVIEQNYGRYQYNSQQRDVLVTRYKVPISSSGGSITFTPYTSGEYEVRIFKPGATGFVSREFYAYGWGDTQSTSFEVDNEGEIDIQLDKEQYSASDKAQVLMKAPFEGKILVTVERDRVFEYYYVNTDKKAASISIDVKDEFLPNVYISATAIRKMSGNPLPLTVARGYVSLNVVKNETKLPVSISANESSRSKSKQHISVKTTPNAELTIAVVDEGILQLKNTATPDPYHYFYQQRALDVSPYDLYPMLFPEYTSYSSALGGDMAEMSKRTNPFTVKRFNLVALWSGILKADGSGSASFDINIPQFSGALRVMAVAYKDNSFGSAEKMIRVADPIVISTSLPRFLSPKDTIRVPVTLTNTTSKSTSAAAEISVTGPLTIIGEKSKSATLKENSEGRVEFLVVANNALGEGNVAISVSGGGEKFSDQTAIAIRPASSLVKESASGNIPAGKTETVTIKADMLPNSTSAKLVLSKSPMVQFSKDLRYLIQFPYGCIEQTVSAAFPQLYYRDLAKAINQDKKATVYNPDYNVNSAIKKIEAMQLYNGAISYWPGGDYESWWGTAYAAHFLSESKKAGFEVNQKILDKIYAYLQQKIKSKSTEEYYYWDGNTTHRRTIAAHEIIYSMFVLATVGKYDQTAMNYYKANLSMLTEDEKYMLAATYALAGNQTGFNQLLPHSFAGEMSERSFGGSFYSAIRDEALALYVLVEADPNNPQIGMMSKHLSEKLKHEYWLSTQEAAFSFLSLGKIARKAQQSNINAKVSVNGKVVGNFEGKDLTITQDIVNQSIAIQTSGTGNLYYYWEMEGISASGKITEEDKYLRVRKTFYDRAGRVISTSAINQNDLVVIKLSIQALDYGASVENVAVTDLLPAGFEIENPRISSIPELDWIKDASGYDYMDIRDDRISYFCTATKDPKNFYYVVRAVSKGLFHMGPVSADAMYNAEYHSYWGAGVVNVR